MGSRQGSFKWDSTYQVDYPHYMTLQTKLQHAGHSNTNVCTGHYFCRHKHLLDQWQFYLSGWLNQPIVSQSSSISCSVDILWMTLPMFISLQTWLNIIEVKSSFLRLIDLGAISGRFQRRKSFDSHHFTRTLLRIKTALSIRTRRIIRSCKLGYCFSGR